MWSLRRHFTNTSVTGEPYSIESCSLSHSWTLWWRVRWLKHAVPSWGRGGTSAPTQCCLLVSHVTSYTCTSSGTLNQSLYMSSGQKPFHLMARRRKWRETCLKLQPCDDAVCTFCFLSRDSTFALVLVCHQWTLTISLYSLTALYQSASGLHNYLVERCRTISGSYLPLRAQWSKSLMAVVSVDDI